MKTIKFLLFLVLSWYPISENNCQAQNAKLSSEFVIQVAVYSNVESYVQNKSVFLILNKYGMVYHDEKKNGVVKVYLKDYDSYFKTREKTNRILKSVKKYRKFKKAFIIEMEGNEYFMNPNIRVKEKELIVTFKIKGEETNIVPDEFNSSGAIDTYVIQLGCFSEDKLIDELASTYGFTLKEQSKLKEILSYKDEKTASNSCKKWLFGRFFNKEDAVKRKEKMEKKCKEELYIVRIHWNGKKNEYLIEH